VPDEHVDAAWGERAAARRERVISGHVEDEIVALATAREVIDGVVDDLVCPQRADHIQLGRAVDAGHVRAQCLGDLHGEGTHAPTRTIDEDALTGA